MGGDDDDDEEDEDEDDNDDNDDGNDESNSRCRLCDAERFLVKVIIFFSNNNSNLGCEGHIVSMAFNSTLIVIRNLECCVHFSCRSLSLHVEIE